MKQNWLRTLLLVVLLLLAVVLGKLLGDMTQSIAFLSWLGMGANFGFAPVSIDLSVMTLTFGILINFNVAQALLLVAAILIYNSVRLRG